MIEDIMRIIRRLGEKEIRLLYIFALELIKK